jgi:hypothetical protein
MDIGHAPMFGDFAILHPHRIQRSKLIFLPVGGTPRKLPLWVP